MCRIDLCGQIGVKIGIYGDRIFLKWDPLNRPWGRFLPREETSSYCAIDMTKDMLGFG